MGVGPLEASLEKSTVRQVPRPAAERPPLSN